jgi:hypothetical protein
MSRSSTEKTASGKAAFEHENGTFRRAADAQIGITYDEHALKQMSARRITRQDVRRVIDTGRVVGVELAHGDEERWKIKGEDVDGDPLVVIMDAITAGDHALIVITVFPPNR